MAYSTSSNNSALKWSYFYRKALDWVEKNKVFTQLGDEQPLPEKYGSQVTWHKYAKLPAVTSAGTEATPPSLVAITSAQITAEVSQYKYAVGYSEALKKMSAGEAIESVIDNLLKDQMAESMDTIARDTLDSECSNILYANGQAALSDVDSADSLTLDDVRQGKLSFEQNDVAKHKSGSFVFIGHPNTLYDMKSDTASGGWIDVFKYTDGRKLFNSEAGQVDDIRFLSTTLVDSTTSGTSGGAAAYTNWMFGYQPFGCVKLDGYSMKMIHHKPGSSGVSDPANELGSLAWKIWFVTRYFGGNGTVSDPDRALKLISGRAP